MKLTDKQKSCPYCHMLEDLLPMIPGTSAYTTIVRGKRGKYAEVSYKDGKPDLLIEINYCPKCGRSLNEEPE